MPDNNYYTMGREERASFVFSHIAIFIVFVWFGALKVFGLSPATPLVTELLARMMDFIPFSISPELFVMLFGGFEVFIGICFIVPRLQTLGLVLLIPHMLTTILPLFLLTDTAWSDILTPTLEGQYIIKNVVIIALATSIYVDSKKRYISTIK
jgi:uncharacterized membrane protein YkgB